MKILMVCLGNICRSPLAEGIMQQKIKEHNLKWIVDSAGTSSWHKGELPDSRMIKCAANHNIDISNQRSRPIEAGDFRKYDMIFAMDQNNYNDILSHARSEEDTKKVHILLSFADMLSTDIPDPYFGGQFGFEAVYKLLDEACEVVLEKLVSVHATLN